MPRTLTVIIGAGLAGSEAALQLADRGFLAVRLVEARPLVPTPVHKSANAARARVLQLAQGARSRKARRACSRPELAAFGLAGVRAPRCVTPCPPGARSPWIASAFSADVTALLEAHPNVRLERAEARSGRRRRLRRRTRSWWPRGRWQPRRSGGVARAPRGSGTSGVLRRGRPHRHGRLAGLLEGLSPKPLRRRRGRLPQRPVRPGGIRRVRPRAGCRRARHRGATSSRATCSRRASPSRR